MGGNATILRWMAICKIIVTRPMAVLGRFLAIIWSPYFRRSRLQWLCTVTGMPRNTIRTFIREVEHDTEFIAPLRKTYAQYVTNYLPLPTDFMFSINGSGCGISFTPAVTLYAMVRALRPEIVVETGGTPGKSSAFILRALERNNYGRLYTIDLRPPEAPTERIPANMAHGMRPKGIHTTKWLLPEHLRARQTLLIGPAQEILSRLLRELGQVDIFFHDSDHSYEHMRWELETAYPFIRKGGMLVADDIRANRAWHHFCVAHHLIGYEFGPFGAARKGRE